MHSLSLTVLLYSRGFIHLISTPLSVEEYIAITLVITLSGIASPKERKVIEVANYVFFSYWGVV